MDALEALCRRDLVFLRSDALTHGLDDKTLQRMLRAGEIVRVRHGAYSFTDQWSAASAEQRHLIRTAAILRSCRCDGVPSHTTAALCLGADTWDMPLSDVHLSRRDHKAGRRSAGVVQHRGRLAPEEITTSGRWTCTTATRTALDITTITDVEHALVTVSSLLHKGLTTQEELRARAIAMKHVPGSLTTDIVLRLADGSLESVGESRSLYAMWREGVPKPVLQYEVCDAVGRCVASLDFAWPELGVWLEFDGKVKYEKYVRPGESASDVVVREKTREDLVRGLTGWTCVRIVWADLAHPERIAAKVRAAFEMQRRIQRAG